MQTEETRALSRTAEVTLYGLEEELLSLLDTEDLVTDPEQRAEIEREIIAVRCAVVEKRDKVAGLIRHCKRTQDEIALECGRLAELAKHYAAVEDRVKGYVAEIIRAGGKDAKGKYKPLEGRTSLMRLQANGGVQALEVTDVFSIPGEFCNITVKMPFSSWAKLDLEGVPIIGDILEPDTALLRAALAEPCPNCEGRGSNGGAETCMHCGGDGKRRVPGARLLPRRESVRVL